MVAPIFRYPLDITGINVDNFVSSEPHILPVLNIRSVSPTYGAYYTSSLVVTDTQNSKRLIRGIHYVCVELLEAVTLLYGQEICYLILITDPTVSSKISVDYQALGGPYTRSADAIINLYNQFNNDGRPVNWPDILNKPDRFNPTEHLHDIGDVYGFEYLVNELERVRQAILLADAPVFEQVLDYIDRQIKQLVDIIINKVNEASALYDVNRIPLVTPTFKGLMSPLDKVRLDSINSATGNRVKQYVLVPANGLVYKNSFTFTPLVKGILLVIASLQVGTMTTSRFRHILKVNDNQIDGDDTVFPTTEMSVTVLTPSVKYVVEQTFTISSPGDNSAVSFGMACLFVPSESDLSSVVTLTTTPASPASPASPPPPPPPPPTPPPPPPPPGVTPGVLSWVTLDNQNTGTFTAGQTFTASVVLKCTGGVGNTPYNVGLNYANCNGTDTGRVGSIAPDGTVTITTTATILSSAQASIIFTIANSSNGAVRNVIANGAGVIVTPPPPPPPAPTPPAPPPPPPAPPPPPPVPQGTVSFLGANSAPTKPVLNAGGTYTISDTVINDTDQSVTGFVIAIGNGANTPKSNDSVVVPPRSRVLVTATFTAIIIPDGNVTGGEVYIYFGQATSGGNSYNYHNTAPVVPNNVISI